MRVTDQWLPLYGPFYFIKNFFLPNFLIDLHFYFLMVFNTTKAHFHK